MNRTMIPTDPLPHYKHVKWEQPDVTFRMYVGYISLLFDIGVLAYHFSTPFHPKFYVKTARRRALRTHILSGCLEIVACVCAFYAEDPTKYAYAAAAFGAIAHVPSTFYQIPTVLGIKAFLVPSLGLVTALHGYFAINLVLNPTSFYYLLSTYLTVHIYAWSRVFFALYYRFKLFEGHRFSAAMLTSGTLLVPSVLGLQGNIILVAFVLTCDGLIRSYTTPDFWTAWTTEHPRELAADPEKKVVLEALVTAAEVTNTVESLSADEPKDRYSRVCATVMSANARNTSPREKAHAVFRAIDVNRDNGLNIEEFKNFLVACGMSPYDSKGKMLLEGLFQDRKIVTADDFCTWFTKSWIHSSSITVPRLPSTPRGQAKLVFDALDADGSGKLDLTEVETLLASWGLPRREAAGYLKLHDKDQSGTIQFQEFYNSMGTVWKFAIQSFIDEGKIRTEE
ncbi:hypothetical protein BG015_004834 [Linnemannia schmuckeri]|uniref:EF-hand domain-containing protein n=1 Tax=Linnemannia schmuckeri TaxID=64567 RepID=A0A9P5S258_9FUNG|nr:hypothetical protein BG015_004834 [Linnemannia schmuckeri]